MADGSDRNNQQCDGFCDSGDEPAQYYLHCSLEDEIEEAETNK